MKTFCQDIASRGGKLVLTTVLTSISLLLSTGATHLGATGLYGLTTSQHLISLDSATPNQLHSAFLIRGMEIGETLLDIDYNPSTGHVLGLGSYGNLYSVDPLTANASRIGSSAIALQLNGTAFGIDYNPLSGNVRVVSNLGQNFEVSSTTGSVIAQHSSFAYASGDILFGHQVNVQAIAHDGSQLFALDSLNNALALETSGGLTTENIVGVPALIRFKGFDIDAATGDAFVSVQSPQSGLYTINRDTGVPVFLGTIGTVPDQLQILGLTVIPEPSMMVLLSGGLLLGAVLYVRRRQQKRCVTTA